MKGEEILTCLILVAIGYFIAKMFHRCANGLANSNGFSVGGHNDKYCSQFYKDWGTRNHTDLGCEINGCYEETDEWGNYCSYCKLHPKSCQDNHECCSNICKENICQKNPEVQEREKH